MNEFYPNVIFIVLDTARSKSFSCYGYPRSTTPNIDRIAQESVIFENALSASPWTLPSHASMFTGLYPSSHGCHEKHKFLNPDLNTIPKVLKSLGYKTFGISNNTWVSKNFGFDEGFDKFINLWQLLQSETDLAAPTSKGMDKYLKALKVMLHGNPMTNIVNGLYGKFFWRRYDYGARRINRILKKIIKKEFEKSQPFFLFINYLEPHLTYKAPEPYFGRFLPKNSTKNEARAVKQDAWAYMGGLLPLKGKDHELLTALYDGEIAYLDYRIGEIYNFLSEKKLLDNSLLIITSDHGENIGEHSLMDHQYCLYDTLLKVPLIIRYPALFKPGERNSDIVQTVDLFPTLLEILELKDIPGIEGVSLLKNNADRFALSEYLAPQPSMEAIFRKYPKGDFRKYDRSLFSLRTRDWKLIVSSDGCDELYNISEDPEETSNLINVLPDVYKELRKKIEDWQGRKQFGIKEEDDINISDEIKKRLESLGYFN